MSKQYGARLFPKSVGHWRKLEPSALFAFSFGHVISRAPPFNNDGSRLEEFVV